MLVIGDIAGQYDALMALLKQCPDREPISLGDMCDRGPDSRKVFEFFISNGKALKGNHEHFIEDFYFKLNYYQSPVWFEQGGLETLKNFNYKIPKEIAEWIKSLPLYYQKDHFFLSHAPRRQGLSLKNICDLGTVAFNPITKATCDHTIIWNRNPPAKIKNMFQIFGHCSRFGYQEFGDYAVCLDSSKQHKLTAIEIPSMTIYQQDYL